MPDIAPFRGIRYDAERVPIEKVVTPPYDVISPAERRHFHAVHPMNVIRLILGEEFPDDNSTNNRYTRAGKYWRAWREEGILQTESRPCYYVYRQQFTVNGKLFTRCGFLARLRLVPFETGIVQAHEETHSAPKEELFALLRATAANFSPVWALYHDGEGRARRSLEQAMERSAPLYRFVDEAGVTQELWALPAGTEAALGLEQVLAGQPVVIADGHHRYESRLRYQAERRAAELARRSDRAGGPEGSSGADLEKAGWNYTLTYFLALEDPGLVILPTHRLVHLPALKWGDARAETRSGSILQLLGPVTSPFTVTSVRPGAGSAVDSAVEAALGALEAAPAGRPAFALVGSTGEAYLFVLNDDEAMRRAAPEHGDVWRRLDVAVLHRLFLDPLLAASVGDAGRDTGEQAQVVAGNIEYTQQVGRVKEALEAGGSGGGADLAVLLRPTRAWEVAAVAGRGEKMPPKSTFFHPKLLTGLVMDDLEIPTG